MGVSWNTLEEYGEQQRQFFPDSTNKCGIINGQLRCDIDHDGAQTTFMTAHRIGTGADNWAEHNFLVLAPGEVYREGADGKPNYINSRVVVDAAIDQFSADNDVVNCDLTNGGQRTLPRVGIFVEGEDAEFNWYNL